MSNFMLFSPNFWLHPLNTPCKRRKRLLRLFPGGQTGNVELLPQHCGHPQQTHIAPPCARGYFNNADKKEFIRGNESISEAQVAFACAFPATALILHSFLSADLQEYCFDTYPVRDCKTAESLSIPIVIVPGLVNYS